MNVLTNNETNGLILNNNKTSPQLGDDPLLLSQLVCYAFITLVTVVGNSLIVISVLWRKESKSSDYFVLNLAISDFAAGLFSIPLDVAEILVGVWPYWDFMCKLVYPLQTVMMAVSVTTLLAMSVERYRAVVTPLKSMPSIRFIQLAVIFIWITGILLATPYALMLKIEGDSCTEQWPEPHAAKVYTMCVFVILYLLPLLLITAFYTLVVFSLYKGARLLTDVVRLHGVKGALMIQKRRKQNIRIVKVFVAAVVVFALCQLPTHVIWLWHDFGRGGEWKHFNSTKPWCNILTYLNSAVDPFIFGSLHLRNWRGLKIFRGSRTRAVRRRRNSNIDRDEKHDFALEIVTSV